MTSPSGHFLLTNLLRELLIDSAPSRVINVSAHGHLFTTLDLDDLMMEKNYGSIRAYCTSKLAQVMFTQELAHRWEGRTRDVLTYCIDFDDPLQVYFGS